MSYTLDMDKVRVVMNTRRLRNLVNITPVDEVEHETISDPNLYGDSVRMRRAQKRMDYDIEVQLNSDDYFYLQGLRRANNAGVYFTLYVSDKRKSDQNDGGNGVNCSIPTRPTNGLEDNPVFRVTCLNWTDRI